jgi:hypothetical protein
MTGRSLRVGGHYRFHPRLRLKGRDEPQQRLRSAFRPFPVGGGRSRRFAVVHHDGVVNGRRPSIVQIRRSRVPDAPERRRAELLRRASPSLRP